MTAGAIHPHGHLAYPTWVPQDVRNYLVHTEGGASLRAIARDLGCHASTILRQVRRNESRRDDPLMDEALERLAQMTRTPSQILTKDVSKMIAKLSTETLPDNSHVDTEARRVLRRLCEPYAVLAIASQMEKAVVVREMPDGRAVRTAVLDRAVAEAFVVKDWIEMAGTGKVARYGISASGRSALKRLLAEQEQSRQGFAEDQSTFAQQHREMEEKDLKQGEARTSKRVRYNAIESPLSSIARRKGKDGAPFLSADLVGAGERLREDFELAQMGPRVAQNWDRFLTGGSRGGFQGGASGSGHEGARQRVAAALQDLGPGLGDVALRVCCFLEGMEQAEKRMGWAARSGKIVLKIALQRLARHYSDQGSSASMIG